MNGLKALKYEKCQIPDYKIRDLNLIFKDYEKQLKKYSYRLQKHIPLYTRLIKKAKYLKGRIVKYSNPFSQDSHIKFLVCSFGGVGSKTLVRGVLQTDNLILLGEAHTNRRTPLSEDEIKGKKIIYVFGNPMNAVVSFFKRRDGLSHLHGFGPEKDTGDVDWAARHCLNLEGRSDLLEPAYDLPSYLTHGIDMFSLDEHFDNWYYAKTNHPILFVKYETMWENLEEIFDFLKLPKSKIINFPKKETRASNWKDEAPEIVDGLEKIYGDLYQKLSNLPDIEIRGNCRQTQT